MTMTERERMLAVYRGETPDRVPFFLDLSHWFYQKHGIPFDLSVPHLEPEWDLIAYHRQVGAGFYVPNLNSYYDVSFPPDVVATTTRIPPLRRANACLINSTCAGSSSTNRIWPPSRPMDPSPSIRPCQPSGGVAPLPSERQGRSPQ